jgi:FixJ family two-component response regulator
MSEGAVCRILIVDDDVRFRSSIERLLRSVDIHGESCQVAEADSGNAAREHLLAHETDCVLIDNCMPGGNGVDWIERLLEAQPTTALVMMTGNGDEETAVAAMKCGAMDYLVKGNIKPAALQRAIGNAVEKRRLRNAVEHQRCELLDAERQRVMFESLGAACHHLGQPVTVLSAYLQLMQLQEKDPKLLEMVNSSLKSVQAISDVLDRLRNVNAYRTEPYLSASDICPERSDERILAI